MKCRKTVLNIIGFLSILFLPLSALASDTGTEMSLFEEIPMVVTPGKKLQPINQSPASVYVVTQEDIKQSGSVHLWDALRQVPGMDVVTATIGQPEVSMRGFANPLSNKTLLLVDGRSVYLPLQGLLLWEMLPVQMEEIDRIEVVKGPVASLYGANANLGLINIITKKPEQIKGGILSTTGGTRDTKRLSVVYGDKKDNLSYKVSTGWKDTNSFNNERSRDALDMVSGNSYVEYKIDDDSKVAVSGGINQGSFYHQIFNQQNSANWFFGPNKNTMTYLQGNYDRGGFSSRIFWNYYKTLYQTAKLYTEAEIHTIESELRYTFETSDKNSIIIGGGGRFDYAHSNLFPGSDNQDHREGIGDIFAQDDYVLSDQWRLNGSVRLDYYDLTGINPSARLAAIYSPSENDTYRASVGYSFRSPTLTEYYLDLTVDVTGGGVTNTTRGNKALEPERYLTYELDYQGRRMNGRLRPFIDIFATRITDFIVTYYNGGGPFGLDGTFRNWGEAWSIGGELGGEYDVTKQFTLVTNAAYNNVDYYHSETFFSPQFKLNSGFKWKSSDNKWSSRLLAHYVSSTRTTIADESKVPQYIYGSLWVGYQMNKDLEFSIAGYNVFNDKHQEAVGGDDIGSRILGNVTLKF